MASFLSTGDVFALTGASRDHFDTFKRNIVIHKKSVVDESVYTNERTYHGYGRREELVNSADNTEYRVSGIYPALVQYRYTSDGKRQLEDIQTWQPNADVRIKVQADAREYLKTRPTDKIEIDTLTYNIQPAEFVQNYHGLQYFIYFLEQIK